MSISTIKTSGFSWKFAVWCVWKNTYQQQNHHGNKAQEPGAFWMKSLLKSLKVKKSPFIMGNLRRPFTPRFGPRFFLPKNSRSPLWRDYWSSPWSPPPPKKKGPFCEAPLDSQDFKLQEWCCVFRDGWILAFLSRSLPRIKARKEIV